MIRRRTRRYLLIGAASVATLALVLGLYFGLTPAARPVVPPQLAVTPTPTKPVAEVLFPELRQEDFYQYVEMVDGEATITDAFIAAVVNHVLVNMQIADGEVRWDFTFANAVRRDAVTIIFTWLPPAEDSARPSATRAYRFTLALV